MAKPPASSGSTLRERGTPRLSKVDVEPVARHHRSKDRPRRICRRLRSRRPRRPPSRWRPVPQHKQHKPRYPPDKPTPARQHEHHRPRHQHKHQPNKPTPGRQHQHRPLRTIPANPLRPCRRRPSDLRSPPRACHRGSLLRVRLSRPPIPTRLPVRALHHRLRRIRPTIRPHRKHRPRRLPLRRRPTARGNRWAHPSKVRRRSPAPLNRRRPAPHLNGQTPLRERIAAAIGDPTITTRPPRTSLPENGAPLLTCGATPTSVEHGTKPSPLSR